MHRGEAPGISYDRGGRDPIDERIADCDRE